MKPTAPPPSRDAPHAGVTGAPTPPPARSPPSRDAPRPGITGAPTPPPARGPSPRPLLLLAADGGHLSGEARAALAAAGLLSSLPCWDPSGAGQPLAWELGPAGSPVAGTRGSGSCRAGKRWCGPTVVAAGARLSEADLVAVWARSGASELADLRVSWVAAATAGEGAPSSSTGCGADTAGCRPWLRRAARRQSAWFRSEGGGLTGALFSTVIRDMGALWLSRSAGWRGVG